MEQNNRIKYFKREKKTTETVKYSPCHFMLQILSEKDIAWPPIGMMRNSIYKGSKGNVLDMQYSLLCTHYGLFHYA